MDCAKAKEYLHPYIDGALAADKTRELEQHLLFCPDCAAELQRLRALSQSLRSLPQAELPTGFMQALHEKLAAEPKPKQLAMWQRGWVKSVAAAACLVLVVGMVAWGGNALRGGKLNSTMMQDAGYDASTSAAPAAPAPSVYLAPQPEEAAPQYEYNMEAEAAMPAPAAMPDSYGEFSASDTGGYIAENGAAVSGRSAGAAEKQLERKIIRDANISLRVDNFAAAYQRLSELAELYGGYVVGSEAYNYDGQTAPSGYITLRVEAKRLDEALAEIEGLGRVENRSVYSQDVTMTYYDIAGRLQQYQAQEQRLLEILAKAETVDELVTVESELTRVRSELESLTGQLRYYDQMTALSSISVNLYQPADNTQTVRLSGWSGFMQDIREGFISGVNWLLGAISCLVVGFFRLLPLLLLLALAVLLLVLLLRRKRRR